MKKKVALTTSQVKLIIRGLEELSMTTNDRARARRLRRELYETFGGSLERPEISEDVKRLVGFRIQELAESNSKVKSLHDAMKKLAKRKEKLYHESSVIWEQICRLVTALRKEISSDVETTKLITEEAKLILMKGLEIPYMRNEKTWEECVTYAKKLTEGETK